MRKSFLEERHSVLGWKDGELNKPFSVPLCLTEVSYPAHCLLVLHPPTFVTVNPHGCFGSARHGSLNVSLVSVPLGILIPINYHWPLQHLFAFFSQW